MDNIKIHFRKGVSNMKKLFALLLAAVMVFACAGMAARTDGRGYVTQQASVQFLRAAKSGRVTARATVRHRGGTVCLIEVQITDEADRLLFLSTFNFYCVRK